MLPKYLTTDCSQFSSALSLKLLHVQDRLKLKHIPYGSDVVRKGCVIARACPDVDARVPRNLS